MRLMLLIVAYVLLATCESAAAQTYPVLCADGGTASAVCIARGKTDSLFLTNLHVVPSGSAIQISDGTKWITGRRIYRNRKFDLASFRAPGTQYRVADILTGVPRGTEVSICGYSTNRQQHCFSGRLEGSTVDGGRLHCTPGDSGGAVMVEHAGRSYCAGIHNAYGTFDGQTYLITADQCQLHLTQYYRTPPRCSIYGQCPPVRPRPNYERSYRVRPNFLAPPTVEYYEQQTTPGPVVTPPPIPDSIGPTSTYDDGPLLKRINRLERVVSDLPEILTRIESMHSNNGDRSSAVMVRLNAIQESIADLGERSVPIRVFNSDGSLYSEDSARRLLDPIEFELSPPNK